MIRSDHDKKVKKDNRRVLFVFEIREKTRENDCSKMSNSGDKGTYTIAERQCR
jgi:hypothetical protein